MEGEINLTSFRELNFWSSNRPSNGLCCGLQLGIHINHVIRYQLIVDRGKVWDETVDFVARITQWSVGFDSYQERQLSRDPNIVSSSLSGVVQEAGIRVRLEIYRLEQDPKWALEVVNDAGSSTVWDLLFDTEEQAFAAFRLVVEEEGMETFLDNNNVIQFPRR